VVLAKLFSIVYIEIYCTLSMSIIVGIKEMAPTNLIYEKVLKWYCGPYYTPEQRSCKVGILEYTVRPFGRPAVFPCPPNNLRFLWSTVFIFGMEVSHD
jgi:hypothetical protein